LFLSSPPVFIFPAVSLGVLAARARRVTGGMFIAADHMPVAGQS
jgi:malic enzyme